MAFSYLLALAVLGEWIYPAAHLCLSLENEAAAVSPGPLGAGRSQEGRVNTIRLTTCRRRAGSGLLFSGSGRLGRGESLVLVVFFTFEFKKVTKRSPISDL